MWGKKMSPHASPYWHAMLSLDSVQDQYGADDGRSVVLYFLSNAAGFRGEDALRLKAELNAHLAADRSGDALSEALAEPAMRRKS